MALFQRIFSSKRDSKSHSKERNDKLRKPVKPKLDKSKIRLVICADTERGRIPYFDSNAIRIVTETEDVIRTIPKIIRAKAFTNSRPSESSMPQHEHTPKYHFQKLGNDVKVLGEMMFGTVAMAFKGLTVKVHLLRSPPQLMVSNVFIPENPSRDSTANMESDTVSLAGSSAGFSSGEFNLPVPKSKEKHVRSIPVDVPSMELMSDYSTEDDNSLAFFTSSGSLRTSLPSPSNGSISSFSSLHRRWMRAQITSLDVHHGRGDGFASELQSSVACPQRHKLAVGIIFGSHCEKDEENNELFQSFFFSHFALIEGHVEKLRCIIQKAYFNSRSFLPVVMEALDTFRNDICNLYTATRLPEPVWLTLTSATTQKTKLCEKFMETFISLVTKYNNKSCKFFVSTLLSAVLTQHLAWVATVTPADGTTSSTYLDKHTAKWVDSLTKSHPYNPLWAQLGDLFGAIGFPRKISRTVVIGKKADIVRRFLYILSYFIRCSEVQENTDLQCLSNIVNGLQLVFSVSSAPNQKTMRDRLEGSSDSTGSNATLVKQISVSSGIINGLNKVSSHWTEQLETLCLKDSNNLKNHSEPLISPMMKTSNELQNHGHLERSDSGYDCANVESSCEQDCVVINSVCADNIPGESASDIDRCDKLNSMPYDSCKDSRKINSVNSDSEISLIKFNNNARERNMEINEKDDSKKTLVQTDSSISSTVEPRGMSELHIYAPNSLSPCSLTSATILNPQTEQVRLVSRLAYDAKEGSEPASKSQALSEGKVRSRLTQRLNESINTVSDTVSKVVISSAGSQVWFPNESKNEIAASKSCTPKQTSQVSKTPPGKPNVLPKNRSLTPKEFKRRRHLSSTGSIDYEVFDPTIHCKEITIPDSLVESGHWHVQDFNRNFGHSLLADYTDHYMSDFVLHGTSDTNYKSRLLNDLQMSVRHSVLDEPIDEAVYVIANTDKWTVEVASSKELGKSPSGCTAWTASKLVADLIESVGEIYKLKMSAEFCLMHLEDRLQEIYFKSVILSGNLHTASTYSQKELADILGCDSSDTSLLLAIAGTRAPSLAFGVQ